MKLESRINEAFPPLAWLVALTPSAGVARLIHGPMVEVGDDWFVEGAWAGDFAEQGYDTSASFFGSGGRVDRGKFLIVPSASTTSYCYMARMPDGRLAFSNSLPLVLAGAGDELNLACRDYLRVNDSILLGINSYERTIPTLRGHVERLIYKAVAVSGGGEICALERNLPPRFRTYEDYRSYLESEYALLVANARSPLRKRPLGLVSTQSRGYDSTAMNAIAVKYGIDKVFTVPKGKGHGKFADDDQQAEVDDSGFEIGRFLGFSCDPIDRRELGALPQIEHLFHCAVHGAQDANLAGVHGSIDAPSLLLMGTLGEMLAPWDYHIRYFGSDTDRIADLQRADHGGHGLGEVRLAAGYIELPFFYIGARGRTDILDIASSEEMKPWRMSNGYDRPISRRIAEESGVPRGAFGQAKNATATVFTPPQLPLSPELRSGYIRELNAEGVKSRFSWLLLGLVHFYNRTVWFVSPRKYRWLYYFQRALSKLLRRNFEFPVIWQELDNSLFAFCVNRRTREYADWLQDPSSGLAVAPAKGR
jgi:hypothetical protein